MPYYPKSQVKTNLYTSDRTFSTTPSNGSTIQTPYIGYYYKISTGETFTGKIPTPDLPQKLYPISSNFSDNATSTLEIFIEYSTIDPSPNNLNTQYNNIPGFTVPKVRLLPLPNLTHPTEQDKQNGYFTRYFCKKNNELKYIEIDKTMFTKLQNQDSQVAWDLYTPASVQWVIKGDLTRVASTNSTNVNIVSRNSNFNGFNQFFKSYTQYYIGTSYNPTNSTLNNLTSAPQNPSTGRGY